MKRVPSILLIFCCLFALNQCAPFTDGNLLVTYARGASITGTMPGSFAEVTKDGSIVQTVDVPEADFTFSGYKYLNGPNLAVTKDFAALISGAFTTERPTVVLAADGTYQIYEGTQRDLRSFYHNGSLYTAGVTGELTYAPLESNRTTLATVASMYDVFIFEDQLYAANYEANDFALAQVGTGTPTNSDNILTTVVQTTALEGYNSQFTFYRPDESTLVLYVGSEEPSKFNKLTFDGEAWVVAYSIDFTAIGAPVNQVVFGTGDGTATLLVTVEDAGIYKMIDTGAAFSPPTAWLVEPDQVFKGISFAPTTCHNGVMDGSETGTDCGGDYCSACPESPAVPVSDTPIDAPLAAPTTAPLASPVSAPQSANTPKASSGFVSVQIGACAVLATSTLMLLI